MTPTYIHCKDWGLKNCPFCGSDVLKIGGLPARGFFIACDCGVDFRRPLQKKDVIRLWNIRKPR